MQSLNIQTYKGGMSNHSYSTLKANMPVQRLAIQP